MSSATAWLLLIFSVGAHAVGPVTMGGSGARYAGLVDQPSDPADAVVNFLDPLSYTKPAYLDVSTLVSIPSSFANTYYVNLSGSAGDGSCSQSSPCNSLNTLSGKTTSGGTRVYLKGNGRLDVTSGTFAGTAGSYVLIKPWPEDSTPAVMTAAGGCGTNNANRWHASGYRYIVWDGGPDMLFRFVGSGCNTGSHNGYTLTVNSPDQVFARVLIDANDSDGPALGILTGAGVTTSNVTFVNYEIYNAGRYYGLYVGGGALCGPETNSFDGIRMLRGIIREVDGRPMQVEPRADSTNFVAYGNAIHNVGWGNVTTSISAAVNPADACGGTTTGFDFYANIMFDLGAGCASLFQDTSTDAQQRVIGNSCYDYAKSSLAAQTQSHGITCTGSGGCDGTVSNNIVLVPNDGGLEPLHFSSLWTSNDNICDAAPCGTTPVTTSGTAGAIFDSTNSNSASFLHPNGSALNNCLIIAGFEIDYLGNSRGTAGSATDCGAINEP